MAESKKQTYHTLILILFLVSIYLIQVLFLLDFGDSFATSPNHLFTSSFYTLLTSIFFHGSLIHLLSNCLALFIFGRIVERHIGYHIYSLFLFGGVVANLFSHLFSLFLGDIFTSWGASGAIATIILFAILVEPFGFVAFVIPLAFLGWLSIYSDILGLFRIDNINQFAHLGGYFATFLLFTLLGGKHLEKLKKGLLINVFAVLLVFGLLYLI
jgi:membrane associated rhomboid family serine protease